MRFKRKTVGGIITAFGIGVLVSAFLPSGFIVFIEAAVIVSVGLLLFL